MVLEGTHLVPEWIQFNSRINPVWFQNGSESFVQEQNKGSCCSRINPVWLQNGPQLIPEWKPFVQEQNKGSSCSRINPVWFQNGSQLIPEWKSFVQEQNKGSSCSRINPVWFQNGSQLIPEWSLVPEWIPVDSRMESHLFKNRTKEVVVPESTQFGSRMDPS